MFYYEEQVESEDTFEIEIFDVYEKWYGEKYEK